MLCEGQISEVYVIEEQTADVDWLTLTTSDSSIRELLFAASVEFLKDLKGEGYTAKPWGMKGYKGWMCGSFRWGTRDTGDIIMMSGEVARANFGPMLVMCENATRVDLAVTVTVADPVLDLAKQSYEWLTRGSVADGRLTRKFTFVENSDGGQTLYIGSRLSDQFGRLYDKGRESSQGKEEGIPQGKIWRYEVEFKGYRAKRIATQILDNLEVADNIHDFLGATVYKWFLSRRVPLIMDTYKNIPFSTEVSAKLSDDETTLNWLSTQVSPSVRRLIQGGKKSQVLDALGLS
jgi:DNA relaxase NicK